MDNKATCLIHFADGKLEASRKCTLSKHYCSRVWLLER